ncbi:MAG: hypothetical protein ACLFTS_01095 [Candidatus Paceibacterota bacterium]
MQVVTVTPLAYTTIQDELTYFSETEIKEGAVVSVFIRKKEVPALVIRTEPLMEVKSRIKSSPFGLKKINSVITEKLYSKTVLKAAEKTAEYYVSPLGSILKGITPKAVLEDPLETKEVKKQNERKMKPEAIALQVSQEERITFYKQQIRGDLARGKMIFILVPTKRDAEYFCEKLKKGIEHTTYLLHGNMTKKETLRLWKELSSDGPKLMISTGIFLSAVGDHLDTLIIEHEASDLYYSNKRPHFDLRFFTRKLARLTGAKLITSDTVLSTETYNSYENERYNESIPLQKRYRGGAPISIIDMTDIKEKEKTNKFLPYLSFSAQNSISENQNGKSFIYTARRGLSPTTTCGDCGFTFDCVKCQAPLVLHGKEKERRFLCHSCGRSEAPADLCPNCKSWKINQLGIGSQKIEEVAQKIFPDREIFRIDSDTAKTEKKEKEILQKFEMSKGGILVGTEMVFNILRSRDLDIDNVLVASMDSLLTYPNYSSGERIFRIIMELSLIVKENLIIQTRMPNQRLISHIKEKKVAKFFEEELEVRESLSYPPFSIPIIITFFGNREKIKEKEKKLEEIFRLYNPLFFPSVSEKKRGQLVKKMLIKYPATSWPDEKMKDRLKSLPPEYKVSVDPPTLV